MCPFFVETVHLYFNNFEYGNVGRCLYSLCGYNTVYYIIERYRRYMQFQNKAIDIRYKLNDTIKFNTNTIGTINNSTKIECAPLIAIHNGFIMLNPALGI